MRLRLQRPCTLEQFAESLDISGAVKACDKFSSPSTARQGDADRHTHGNRYTMQQLRADILNLPADVLLHDWTQILALDEKLNLANRETLFHYLLCELNGQLRRYQRTCLPPRQPLVTQHL